MKFSIRNVWNVGSNNTTEYNIYFTCITLKCLHKVTRVNKTIEIISRVSLIKTLLFITEATNYSERKTFLVILKNAL